MSKSEIVEKIKEKAKTVKELNQLHEKNFWDNFQGRKDWEKKWEEECKNNKWIRLQDVLGLLDGCVLVKEEKLKELADLLKSKKIDIKTLHHPLRPFRASKRKVSEDFNNNLDEILQKFAELTEKEREK